MNIDAFLNTKIAVFVGGQARTGTLSKDPVKGYFLTTPQNGVAYPRGTSFYFDVAKLDAIEVAN